MAEEVAGEMKVIVYYCVLQYSTVPGGSSKTLKCSKIYDNSLVR